MKTKMSYLDLPHTNRLLTNHRYIIQLVFVADVKILLLEEKYAYKDTKKKLKKLEAKTQNAK